METTAAPVANERALLVSRGRDRTLVVADLHIGLEHELAKHGINVPSATPNMLRRTMNLLEQVRPEKLVILGDLKHSFAWTSYREEMSVNDFFGPLSKLTEIEIVQGNHDGDIGKILPKAVVHPSSGFVRDSIGYFHGHAWPSEELLSADSLICAHVHPNISITGLLGSRHTEPCWLRASINPAPLKEHYPKASINGNAEIILMPAFNPLLGGLPVNKNLTKLPSGYRIAFNKCIDFKNSEVFLIDGTNLGKLKGIR